MSKFTPKQEAAWVEVLADLAKRGIRAKATLSWPWHIDWDEEVRPGRGRTFRGMWFDEYLLADVTIDVYGGWEVATADLTWLHNSADDECSCDLCEQERREEEGRGA